MVIRKQVIKLKFSEFSEYVLCGREIEFTCREEKFFIGNGNNGIYLSNDTNREVQYFKNHIDLIQKAKVFNNLLKDIWTEIEVEYIL